MATEQIQTNQIAGFSPGGGQMATQHISLSGGSSTKVTSAFGFVVGTVLIEITASGNNATEVYAVLWVNMRSYSGTKTADVTARKARGLSSTGPCFCNVSRNTSGTILSIGSIDTGQDVDVDGTVISLLSPKNWANPGALRITAWEDTQS